MTTYTLDILVQGKDQASGPLGGFGNALGRVSEIAAGVISAQALEKIASKILDIGTSSFMTAARVEEMGAVLSVLGKNSGYSQQQMDGWVASVKDMGIQTGVAQDVVASFVRSGMDMAMASKLARVAQDAAVLSMQDSSTTLSNLIYGVQTMNTEVLRTNGIIINGQQAYDDYAKSIGKTASELTSAEKQQAFLNAVVAAGVPIQGAYESAMDTAGKQLRSFPRYFSELGLAIGDQLLPAISPLIFKVADLVKNFTSAVSEGGALHPMIVGIGNALDSMGEAISNRVLDPLDKFITAIKTDPNKAFIDLVNGMLGIDLNPVIEYFKKVFDSDVTSGFTTTINNVKAALSGLQAFMKGGGGNIANTLLTYEGDNLKRFVDFVSTKFLPFISEMALKVSTFLQKNGPLMEAFSLQVVKGLSMIQDIVLGLWSVLEPLLSGVIDLILGVAKPFMQAATGDWSGAWKTMGDTAVQVGGAIWKALVALINWIAGLFGTSLAQIGATWSNNWNMFVNIVTAVWDKIVSGISGAIASVWGSITGFLSGIGTGAKNSVSGVGDFFASMSQGIQNAFSSMEMAVSTAWENIKTSLAVGFDNFLNAMGITDEIRARWAAIWDDIVLIVSVVWQRLMAAIGAGIATFIAWISAVWQSIWLPLSTTFITIWTVIASTMTAIWNAIVLAWSAVWAPISDTFTQIWDAVTSIMTTIWNNEVTGATVIWNALVSTISSILGTITSVILPIITNIKSFITNKWGEIKTAVSGKMAEIVTVVGDKIGEILTKFTEKAQAFIDAGKNIALGMLKGIKDGWSQVVEWVTAAIERLLAAIKSKLGISSPSKVAEGIFFQVPAGGAKGIQRGASLMQNAMNKAVDGVISEPSVRVSNFTSAMMGSGSSSSSVVTNKIEINVSGSDEPDKVADEILKKLRLQGVNL